MYEVDFLQVGEGTRSGDAIMMRFTRPDTGTVAHVILDAGFQDTGEAMVEHVETYYQTRSIDVAILTHPDGDHIGGMGTVIRELDVAALGVHRLDLRGGATLDAASAVAELCGVAQAHGTALFEPFAGLNAFDGALLVAGPTIAYYDQCVTEQLEAGDKAAGMAASVRRTRIAEAVQKVAARALTAFPIETNFDDAGGDNPRNNSSAIVDLRLPNRRFVFTADAGVPAINNALEFLDAQGRTDRWPDFVQIPHHGSRHNLDRATVERLVGSVAGTQSGTAFISISAEAAKDPRYPSPRVANAFGRRRYKVCETAARSINHHSADAPERPSYSPLEGLPPLDESIDDR